jgi:hypothetical protein
MNVDLESSSIYYTAEDVDIIKNITGYNITTVNKEGAWEKKASQQ